MNSIYYSDSHLQREDLRELDPKFLVIPPQVVTVEMSGLQEYKQSETLINQINQNLLGKPLAAMVENRPHLGKRITNDDDDLPRLIFFDTSTEDVDVNINQKLIEFIGSDISFLFISLTPHSVQENSQSKLPKIGGEEIRVRVPSIHSNGDLYVMKEVDRNGPLTVSIFC